MQYYILCHKRAVLRGKPTRKTDYMITVDIWHDQQNLATPEISVAGVFGFVNNVCCYAKTFVNSVCFRGRKSI